MTRITDCKDNMNNMLDDFSRLSDESFDAINKRLDFMFTNLINAPGMQGPDGMPYIQEFENAHSMHGMLTDVQQDGDVMRATFEYRVSTKRTSI